MSVVSRLYASSRSFGFAITSKETSPEENDVRYSAATVSSGCSRMDLSASAIVFSGVSFSALATSPNCRSRSIRQTV